MPECKTGTTKSTFSVRDDAGATRCTDDFQGNSFSLSRCGCSALSKRARFASTRTRNGANVAITSNHPVALSHHSFVLDDYSALIGPSVRDECRIKNARTLVVLRVLRDTVVTND